MPHVHAHTFFNSPYSMASSQRARFYGTYAITYHNPYFLHPYLRPVLAHRPLTFVPIHMGVSVVCAALGLLIFVQAGSSKTGHTEIIPYMSAHASPRGS